MSPSQLEVYRLGVVGDCAEFVRMLVIECPNVAFTSGRRTRQEQAWAMAQNVVIGGRKWVAKTYKASKVNKSIQSWIDKNPNAIAAHDIAIGITEVLSLYTDEELESLSKHFTGKAVDIQPVDGSEGDFLLMSIRRLCADLGGTFIDREGGLRRWHCQFRK